VEGEGGLVGAGAEDGDVGVELAGAGGVEGDVGPRGREEGGAGRGVDAVVGEDVERGVEEGGVDRVAVGVGEAGLLTLNYMPLDVHGAVVTLRDRTELMTLRDELDANRHATDTLRAQAHEFSNRLHTIAGLVELGEYDEVRGFISRINTAQGAWRAEVGSKVADPAVAALLIAKSSLAAERGIGLRMAPDSSLGAVDEALSTDLVTVIGNLVDNALDALAERGWIEVSVRSAPDEVVVVVRDSGPGVAAGLAEEVFRHGFTTKAAEQGRRGLGLALTRQTCLRRGGSVRVHNEDGAVFTARLPVEVPV
jgi:sensor histidine kinase regulating citrate/malate metabolism